MNIKGNHGLPACLSLLGYASHKISQIINVLQAWKQFFSLIYVFVFCIDLWENLFKRKSNQIFFKIRKWKVLIANIEINGPNYTVIFH